MATQNTRTGTLGTPLRVVTNSYEIKKRPQLIYYHYDVAISPDVKVPRRAHEIVDKMQLEYPNVFNPRAAYDGKKNLFAPKPIQNAEYNVHMSNNPEKGVFSVKLMRVAAISPADIDRLIAPGGAGAAASTMAVNLLQIIIRQAPNKRHGFPPEARSFFVNQGNQELAGGLQAWHGYFQSVRPVLNRLLINVDVANAVMYSPGPLEGLALKFLGRRDIRDLDSGRLRPGTQEWMKLRTFLKGVQIRPRVGTDRPTTKGRPIRDIVERAGDYQFEKDGTPATVTAYFREKYGYALRYPGMFGVRIGKDAVFPAEVCEVIPGQLYRKKLSPENTTQFLRFSVQKPHERLMTITNGVNGQNQVFDYNNSDVMKTSGMVVDSHPIQIRGRVLNTPQIRYKSGPLDIRPKSGAWNVLGRTLQEPGTINVWAVAMFDPNTREDVLGNFVTQLQDNLQKLGVRVMTSAYIARANPYQVENELLTIAQTAVQVAEYNRPPSLILAFLPVNAPDIRRRIKHWGDVDKGVPTQCLRAGKWERARDQYINNVALKINAKLGGVNSAINAKLLPQCTMVIGADVGHPGPGIMNRPSVTSLVASVDPDATKYTTYASVQAPRVEIIQDLEQMVTRAISDFRKFWDNKAWPEMIVFYRDGVSEGEYAQVAQQEVQAINNALLNYRALAPDGQERSRWTKESKPKLVFIVVGKRHHIRFFPESRDHADSSGNCPPGFVVDDQITNAVYPDFYLQSHSGIQGTSRPSHYIVIENEPGATIDQIQELSFRLCHVYQSATRSVSIPAPVYYADRVCARAEFHFTEEMRYGDSDAATTVSDKDAPFPLEQWQQGFRQSLLGKAMYFL